MVKLTHDALNPDQQKLYDEGKDVILSDYINVAYGTPGHDVHTLVRYGLWKKKEIHQSESGSYYNIYGPIEP
jgi:hypothetical protein